MAAVDPSRRLAERLRASGAPLDAEPLAAWQWLRAAEGRSVTIIDLYDIAAAGRGLAAHELPRAERRELAQSALPFLWPNFEIAPQSARRDEPIEVVEADPDWGGTFARWRDRLADGLGVVACRIEHVGSTAVPGLAAKPTIDIQVSVDAPAEEHRYLPALLRCGLQLCSRDDLHRFLLPPPSHPREVHVHVCAVGSVWEREHLLFRDYLRAHRDERGEYAAAKWTAARTWADDRWAYTEAKSEVILALLGRAETWAGSVGWSVGPRVRPGPAPSG
ncbi:MAG TPA: GrpB family protein [Mycobacteriales bacterium]|nr:GrpB family protein [Mycobacteriales bacterium]